MQAFHWFIMIHFCKIKLQQWIIIYKSGSFCLQKWIIIYKSGSLFTKVDHFAYKSGSLSRVTHATFSLVDSARRNTGNLIGPTVGISGFRPLGTKKVHLGTLLGPNSDWAHWAQTIITTTLAIAGTQIQKSLKYHVGPWGHLIRIGIIILCIISNKK